MPIRKNNNHSEKLKRILVIGDWVIDEHWVTGIHRSPTSSRTGQSHRRALHSLNSTTQSFCGAGQTASILYQAVQEKNKKFCEVVGVGIWHKDDTDTLATMLNPTAAEGQTPHKVIRPPAPTGAGKDKLFNLGDMLNDKNISYGTTRVMRIYQQTGAKIELIQRLDWELPVPPDKNGWIIDTGILIDTPLDDFLKRTTFDAVILKDLCKGVISDELVKFLANKDKLKKVPWFVSSKEWKPDWLKLLPRGSLRLLLVPQVASRMAVINGALNSWITKSGYASNEAINEINRITNELDENPFIVVLPHGLSILARDCDKKERRGWLQIDSTPHPLTVGMPMASVFFPALVANLLNNGNIALEILLKKALDFTQKWMSFQVDRITKPGNWTPKGEPPLNLNSEKDYSNIGVWKRFSWEWAKKEWTQAFSAQGIVEKRDARKLFEMKRAMSEVEGYVCIVKSKRKMIQKLVQELVNFKSKDRQHPVSCMLIDSPGSGKTFLVRCLAKSLNMLFLPFNITQMLSKNDILDCFDTIVTTQARNKDEAILIFFDEINAMLEGQQVYDTFLAPLEEGVYVRAGKTFHIDPCFWVFAGTERPVQEDEPLRNSTTKASDFESRFTVEPLDLKINVNNNIEMNEARIEKVYLGVSLLRTFFPDVRRVSEKVLQLFHLLSPDLEVREIEHLVKSFVNIQYGDVLAKNVSTKWLEEHQRHEFDILAWKNIPEGEIVEIIG